MNMQCNRCLSSLFPKLGAQGCVFCAGQEVKRLVPSLPSKPDTPLSTNLVKVRPSK